MLCLVKYYLPSCYVAHPLAPPPHAAYDHMALHQTWAASAQSHVSHMHHEGGAFSSGFYVTIKLMKRARLTFRGSGHTMDAHEPIDALA